GITKRLLEHWNDREEFERRRFFFCQLEAVETLIWLAEAQPSQRAGINIPSDGGPFQRRCAKMATGSGKTVVMAMVIAWHVLNKVANPGDVRFAKNILVVAPGLTVRSRLAVLKPSHPDNYYEEFRVVPPALRDKLRRGKVVIRNWHALSWETEERVAKKRGVDKRGPKSDAAYVRDVLGEMASARNLLVINDEAHHAWRVPTGGQAKGVRKSAVEEATKWVGGLDRIHRARGVLACYDFSATPFVPSGRQSSEEALFGWIVSDFGLNDAIESGLVKTPRVVIRDDAVPDAKAYRSRLYHIYQDPEVKDDLNRRAKPEEPLPDLVTNGYYLLGYDWRETAKDWTQKGAATPPVMITVANRTETAARIKYAFDSKRVRIDELCDPDRTLHIDSKALSAAEAAEEPLAELGAAEAGPAASNGDSRALTSQQRAELLRRQVDTVGRPGHAGERIQNVISVGMLSEGWDAKTVTHIMGLRAFSSQLLCEQVVGRGLRRTSYDVNPETGLFEPEHVNVFGVPFTFLPHEGREDGHSDTAKPKTAIEPVAGKSGFSITWPNVVRIDYTYRPLLSLDMERVAKLRLDAARTARLAEVAPMIDGRPDITKIDAMSLDGLAREFRTQKVVFETARDVYEQMQQNWPGNRMFLLAQLVRLVELFMRSGRIVVTPEPFAANDLQRRLVITLNMTKVVQHICEAIRLENEAQIEPVFDRDQPIRTTGDMRTWFTSKPCAPAARSHVNFCVFDSTWEASDAFALDHAPEVTAWVKNDHLGFEVFYVH
ncbi:MAG: DEAD/DEAH box helicase family protein, partial [bacterium]|nr:DEAD/DEAH box helicase family protein [bacterium]